MFKINYKGIDNGLKYISKIFSHKIKIKIMVCNKSDKKHIKTLLFLNSSTIYLFYISKLL